MLALSIELCDSLSLSLEGSYVLLSGSLMLIPWILFEYQFLQVPSFRYLSFITSDSVV